MRGMLNRAGAVGLVTVAALGATPAGAHHAMDGKLPETFFQGLLSGLGHPVIGPDHLAFIVAIGIAAALLRDGRALIAAFVAASIGGVLIHLARIGLPLVEPIVATTVVIAGASIAVGRSVGQPAWIGLALLAGLFHGYAFGESIVGAETTVVGAYLVGLAIIMALIAAGVMTFARLVLTPTAAETTRLRTAGAMLGCIGVVMLTGTLVG